MATTFIGFDSAWADNPRKPGAICALRLDGAVSTFTAPVLASFDEAFGLIRSLHRDGDLTLIAIDQPTIVPNETRMRPAERVVAGTIGWSGGGMQPAYRKKEDMFGEKAPIWTFLGGLAAIGCLDDPERAVGATRGLFVMEVYPALALLSLDDAFVAGRGRRPCYNPANRAKFRHADWLAVCTAVAADARRFGLDDLAAFCDAMVALEKPGKADQDKLDAAICLLVAKRWRDDRVSCAMIGDTTKGYVVAPVGAAVRARLEAAAKAAVPPVPIRQPPSSFRTSEAKIWNRGLRTDVRRRGTTRLIATLSAPAAPAGRAHGPGRPCSCRSACTSRG